MAYIWITLQLLVPCWVLLAHCSKGAECSYMESYPPANGDDATKSLHIALIASFSDASNSSATVIPGVQAALDAINSDQTVLPGYSLHYTLTDSQVCLGSYMQT